MIRHPSLAIFLILITGAAVAVSPDPASAEDQGLVAVSGLVTDENGNAIEGAEVSGTSWSETDREPTYDRAVTDDAGRFTIHLQPGKASLSAWYGKWNRGGDLGVEVPAEGLEGATIQITSPPPKDAIVAGIVRDGTGKPIEGAHVTLNQGCCYAYAEPARAETAPTPAPTEASTPPSSGSGSSTASSDAVEPMPAEGRSMPIFCCADYDYQETTTGADGRFTFTTYAGPRMIGASAKGHASVNEQVDAVSGQTVEAELVLEKVPDATAVLKGRVLDKATGLPVAGAGVNINQLAWNRYEYATTGPDGTFTFTTIPGWVQLSVYANRGCCYDIMVEDREVSADGDASKSLPAERIGPMKEYYQYTKSFLLGDGESNRDFELTPKPSPTIVLTGYVVDPATQKAIPNAWINVWNQETSDWGSAQTDSTGSYKILVREGYHQVSGWAEGYLGGSDVVLVAGPGPVRFDLEMAEGTPKNAWCDACYIREMAAGDATTDGGAPTPQPGANSVKTSTAPPAMEEARSGAPSSDSDTSVATYQGTGGGLPPYDPNDAGTVPSTQEQDAKTAVPGFGLLALVAAGALVALATRRK